MRQGFSKFTRKAEGKEPVEVCPSISHTEGLTLSDRSDDFWTNDYEEVCDCLLCEDYRERWGL